MTMTQTTMICLRNDINRSTFTHWLICDRNCSNYGCSQTITCHFPPIHSINECRNTLVHPDCCVRIASPSRVYCRLSMNECYVPFIFICSTTWIRLANKRRLLCANVIWCNGWRTCLALATTTATAGRPPIWCNMSTVN